MQPRGQVLRHHSDANDTETRDQPTESSQTAEPDRGRVEGKQLGKGEREQPSGNGCQDQSNDEEHHRGDIGLAGNGHSMTEIAQEVREKRIALRMGFRFRTPWIEQHRERDQQVKEETDHHDHAKNTDLPEGIVRKTPSSNPGPMSGGRRIVHALIVAVKTIWSSFFAMTHSFQAGSFPDAQHIPRRNRFLVWFCQDRVSA